MFMKHRTKPIGNKNLIGTKVVTLRKEQGIKQKEFLAMLQTQGIDISATSLSRLEGQYRLVTDFEIVAISKLFRITTDELLSS